MIQTRSHPAPKNTQRRWKFRGLLAALVLLASAVSCSSPPPGNSGTSTSPEASVFSGQPCAPPCWYGIIPAETDAEALPALLQANPFVDQSTIRTLGPAGSVSLVTWRFRGSKWGGTTYILEDRVQLIYLASESQLTFRDIVKRFGQPTKIQTDTGMVGQDQTGTDATVYYPDLGLGFHLQRTLAPSDAKASVQADLKMDWIYLFRGTSMDDLVSTAREFGEGSVMTLISTLAVQDWHGYGQYPILPHLGQ